MVREIANDATEKKVIDDIATFGWHCVSVLAKEGLTGFSFTVGNYHSYEQPEFIIFGLNSNVAHQLLHLAVTGVNDGAIVDLSVPTEELLNGYPCMFVKVPETEYHEHVGFARWYYEGNAFPLYQIVWPSKEGHFLWDTEASKAFRAAQPVLADSGTAA